MLNTIVLIGYLMALAVFVLISVLALRHTVKFGYISQKFMALAWVFGVVAVAIIIFSVYLITTLYRSAPGVPAPANSVKNINF